MWINCCPICCDLWFMICKPTNVFTCMCDAAKTFHMLLCYVSIVACEIPYSVCYGMFRFHVYLLFVLVVDAVLLIPLTQLSCQHVPSQWGRGFMALPLCYYCVNNVVFWTFLDVLSLCYSAPTPGPVGFMAYIVKNTHYL